MLGRMLQVPEPPWKSSAGKGGDPKDPKAEKEQKGCDTVGDAARVFLRCPSPRLILLFVAIPFGFRLWVGGASPWDAAVVLGIAILWAFQEWFAHIYILHAKPRRLFGREVDLFFSRKHRHHHREPWRLDTTLLPLRVIVVAAPFTALFWWLAMPTPALALTAMTTYSAMALLYEWTHYLTHTPYVPKTALYKRICKAHRLHHFKNEHYWMGFIIPWVDDLFRTSPDPASVDKSPTVRTLGVDEEDPNAFLI